jgi:hypothetical protein
MSELFVIFKLLGKVVMFIAVCRIGVVKGVALYTVTGIK